MPEQQKIPFLSLFSAWTPGRELQPLLTGLEVRSAVIERSARAVLADPAIFVLDEATSSIDTQTEQLIQDAISYLLKNRTSFLIAHRLSTIRKADIILVVRDGKIIEQGTHEGLLKKQGYYYTLYRNQFEQELSQKTLA